MVVLIYTIIVSQIMIEKKNAEVKRSSNNVETYYHFQQNNNSFVCCMSEMILQSYSMRTVFFKLISPGRMLIQNIGFSPGKQNLYLDVISRLVYNDIY